MSAPEGQIAWTLGEPPKDGSTFYGHVWMPFRWKAYKPSSEQFRRMGLKGRWQAMNEYGGWDNAKAPNEWAPEAAIQARLANANPEASDASLPPAASNLPASSDIEAIAAGNRDSRS